MQRVAFLDADGKVCILGPAEGARLATRITFEDGSSLVAKQPQHVDLFLRKWPVHGVSVEWAETEDEWVKRIAAKDVPAGATNVCFVDELPPRETRESWRIVDGKLV